MIPTLVGEEREGVEGEKEVRSGVFGIIRKKREGKSRSCKRCYILHLALHGCKKGAKEVVLFILTNSEAMIP
jgi:hypothetical protein